MATPSPNYESYIHAKDNRDLRKIPGTFSYPVIGHTFSFIKDPLGTVLKDYYKYGPVSRFSLVNQRMIATVGPDFVKLITTDPDKVFSSRMGWEGTVGEFFDGSLIVMDFDDHRLQRRIMQSAFKTDSLRGYIDSINAIVGETLATIPVQHPLPFYTTVKALLLNVAAKVFLGAQLDEEGTRLNRAFVDFAYGTTSIIKKDWPGFNFRKGLKARGELEQFIQQSIDERRANDGTDMFSYFCREKNDQGDYFGYQEISDHMIFLLFAAHDTTTSALTMAMYLLAKNQDYQTQLREEFAALTIDQLSYDQLDDAIPLLDYTFKEVLRMYPPVPGIVRRTVKPSEIGGFEIPAHTVVNTSIVATHYLEEYWRDPFTFDPLRFSDARQEHKQHPFLWTPFGGGAHKCIGLHFANMLFKCVLFQTVKQFRVEFADEKQRNGRISYIPFTRPKDNLPLILGVEG